MAVKLMGKKAELLHKGCIAKKAMDSLKLELTEIKEELEIEEPGTYTNSKGDILIVGKRQQYSDIQPSVFLAYLKRKRKGTNFIKCVKVVYSEAKKYIDKKDLSRLRKSVSFSLSFSWK